MQPLSSNDASHYADVHSISEVQHLLPTNIKPFKQTAKNYCTPESRLQIQLHHIIHEKVSRSLINRKHNEQFYIPVLLLQLLQELQHQLPYIVL